jgi:hypothetical protein
MDIIKNIIYRIKNKLIQKYNGGYADNYIDIVDAETFNNYIYIINVGTLIKKDAEYFLTEIFPMVDNKNCDLIKIVMGNIQCELKEHEYQIEKIKRYDNLTGCDKDLPEERNKYDIIHLEKIKERLLSLNIMSEMEQFKDRENHLIEGRLICFDEELKILKDNNRIENTFLSKDQYRKYKEILDKNYRTLYKFMQIWNYYDVNKLNQQLETDVQAVDDLYKHFDIDINTDKQFLKYQLVSARKYNNNPPQIYDDRLRAVIFLKNVPVATMEFFKKNSKYIVDIAFQIDPLLIIMNETIVSLSMEHLEIGKAFDLEDLGFPSLDKLYDDTYNNILWVKKEIDSITFEEILDDFIYDQNNIITQVLHFRFIKENGNIYIVHMDHEYILYDIESYELKKRKNILGKNKIKTFKIDNSKIPFFFNNGENIFYHLLNIYFKNLNLIKEYFIKYLNNQGQGHCT